jgi:hypothetical protein
LEFLKAWYTVVQETHALQDPDTVAAQR